MTTFRVWAPLAEQVQVEIDENGTAGRHAMAGPSADGWWHAEVASAGPGTDYSFVVDDGEPTPDPRSRWQPFGVHGRSRVVDHDAYPWQDHGWRGIPLRGSVIYELHVGTFTPEGTFDAAIERLPHLVDLGVSHVELLPVNAFPGQHGWGYDGVDLFAVHHAYGGPEGLKRFVDACHAAGLGVLMDVVYNHLGPAGNYLARFGPYFTETHHTPWGPAVNLDAERSDEVRRFILDNALMWLRDYHCDGLRLDAVHALADDRAVHILEELSVEVDQLEAQLGRTMFLIAESDLNNPRLVTPREAGGDGLDGQWSDDFHHALHALLTGERQGYYCDFGSLAVMAKAIRQSYVHDGTWSTFRGRHHGRPPLGVPGHRLLAYLQDHDQVGNRAQGDRISATLPPALLKVGAALVLTSPFTPMLWMGEEWGATTPWQFFTDHEDPELAEAVRNGRRSEFTAHGWGPEDVPDPQDPATFQRSKLDWAEPGKEPHAELLAWYRALLRLRRTRPELADDRLDRVSVSFDEDAGWLVVQRAGLLVAVNLAATAQDVPLPATGPLRTLLASAGAPLAAGGSVRLAAQSVAILVP